MTALPAAHTLREVLGMHVDTRPECAFLVAPETGATVSYAEIDRHARRLAGCLRAAGIGRGDKVAFFLHNSYQTAVILLGAMVGGHVVVPLNLLASRAQLRYTLGHCDCKAVFTAGEHAARLRDALAGIDRKVKVMSIDPDAPDAWSHHTPVDLASVDADDPALLMYTSGTTGIPKGAVLTHRNLLAAARSVVGWHGLTAEDRCLSSLPLYHINGLVIATLAPFFSGGSIIAPHRFSVSTWWPLVQHHRATWLNLVPTIIAYLLNAAAPGARASHPTVRFGRSASAPLPPEQHKAFEHAFGISVIEAMGMTESASVVFANPQDPARRKYGTPGLPCGVEAVVIDPDDATRTPFPDHRSGEILLRGPNVMAGYYKAPELTAQALESDGWLHTGDLGYRDADGFYFVTGRLKELIIKGGENIAPREIDEVLLRHPAVLEAATVGIPDPAYGQEILACIVRKPGAQCGEDELRAFCAAELGRYKTPKIFRFVAELPKGPSGKVQRLKLAESGPPRPQLR